MTGVLVPSLELSQQRLIRKARELPLAGEVLVQVGQIVQPDSVVLRASLPGDLSILRIPERLGIEPEEVVELLNKSKLQVGQEVKRGELICEHVGLFGLFRSRFVSPVDGVIEYISEINGHVGVRQASKKFDLNAYIAGEVREIIPGRAVVIEGQACFVQGIFGVGGERNGVIEVLPIDPDKVVSMSDLPGDLKGKILIGGTNPSCEVLKYAASKGALGFITGAIDDQSLKGYLGYDLGIALTGDEQISMSVIVTEGFGKLPISERVLDLLKVHHGKLASINGATQVRAGALRPEIIVCLDAKASSNLMIGAEERTLKKGAKVRLIRVPYFGQIGEIVELPQALQKIETGAEARVAIVNLGDKEVSVPRANLELI